MSILPFRFFESWQAKQFSFNIGATSLMKLIGFLAGAGVCAEATGPASNRMPRPNAAPRMAHRTQKQNRLRNMVGRTPSRVGAIADRVGSGGQRKPPHYKQQPRRFARAK